MFTKKFKFNVTAVLFILFTIFQSVSFAQLSQVWTRVYNGVGNHDDDISVSATKVDVNGNLIVTGWSDGVGTDYDYVVIKYSPAGSLMWQARYTGIGGTGKDYSYALALDNAGNIYVTGKSQGGGSDFDVATVKYNTNGQLQWVQRYNGADNGPDWATCITLDAGGNVCIGGRTEISGSGTRADYLTIKYSTSGVMLWARTYDGPSDNNDNDEVNSIAADASGNIIVTGKAGWTGYGYDIVNIKYTSAGVGGATRFDGSSNGDDEGIKVLFDASGNWYVTGYTRETNLGLSITTTKFSSGGVPLWTRYYNYYSNKADEPRDMKVDASGVYITGYSEGNGTESDYITIKYSTAGTQLWATRLNGPYNFWDEAKSIAVDNYGNVYVTGESYGANMTEFDFATVKYSPQGVQLGNVLRYNGPIGFYDKGRSIAIDNTGANVYVTGMSNYENTSYTDIVTIKYSQPVGIENNNSETPDKFSLEQNYPNPFNPSTTIGFSLRSEGNVSIKIYDIQGKEVANPVEEKLSAGSYEFKFDASKLSSGTYFYKMVTSDFTDIKKMMLVK